MQAKRGSEGERAAKLQSVRLWDWFRPVRSWTMAAHIWFDSSQAADFFLRPPTLTARNFDALWPTDPIFTLSVTHSRSIVILWYDFKSFWHGKKHPKSSTTTLSSWLLADTYQGFPKRYHNSILVMGFQSCKLIKFEIFDLFESPMLTRVFSRAPLNKT